MYPEQPPLPPYQPPSQPPIDYLNQIAPQAPKRSSGPSKFKKVIIIGILAVVVVSIISMTVGAITGAQREPSQKFGARLLATQVIAEDAQDNLKSSQLRSLNSDLRLYLTNTIRDAEEPLKRADVNLKKIDGGIQSKEEKLSTGISERLEDARLNAIFDRTYAREMAYQLETMLALMQQIYKSTNSNSLKEFLDNAYKNLQPTQQTFEEFNESIN